MKYIAKAIKAGVVYEAEFDAKDYSMDNCRTEADRAIVAKHGDKGVTRAMCWSPLQRNIDGADHG